jgi:hypothetical protein
MSQKKKRFLAFFTLLFFNLIILLFILKQKSERPLIKEDIVSESYELVEESEDSVVENFPDIPQYPSSEIVSSKFYNEEGGEGYSLDLTTNDSVMDVINWYKEVLENKNWYLIFESEPVESPTYFLIEYKKPNIQLDVSAIQQDEGKTRVVITHHEGMYEYGPVVKYELE